jgi:polyhydroxybutyrate depolymerase
LRSPAETHLAQRYAQRVCAFIALIACAVAFALPVAAAQDSAVPQRANERHAQKKPVHKKQVQKKKAQKKKPAARKRKPRAGQQPPRQRQVVAPQLSTDTEARITRPGDYRFSIRHGGLTRTYRVHVPPGYNMAVPAPLLVALHGDSAGTDLRTNDANFGLVAKSDREGFIVVFPSAFAAAGAGKLASWNAGNCCGAARDQNVDDVGFIRQVVTNVFRQMSIDRERIFAAGISDGGMMAYRLACEMPEVFRAVASVAGTDNTGTCAPGTPVSVLHIHAKDDPRVLFDGGATADAAAKPGATALASVPGTVAKWAQLDGCAAQPRHILDKAGAYCEEYSWCRGGAKVQLCVTDTGGHSWPGGKKRTGAPASRAISATDSMWEFFSQR